MSLRSMYRIEAWRRSGDWPLLAYGWDEGKARARYREMADEKAFRYVQLSRRNRDGSYEVLQETR